MRNWLIYEPPGGARLTLDDAETFVIVREGFSKVAFLFAPFWLATKRCWLALALWAAAFIAAVLLVRLAGIGGGAASALLALPSLAVGFENAWIQARKLEREGFTHAGSALASTREEAEVAFFQDWLATRAPETATGRAPYRPASSGVLGLFPEARAAR